MSRSSLLAIIGAALTIVIVLGVASASISPGTKITGAINTGLSSKDSQVGQTFRLTDAHSSDFDINGATVYGHVDHIQRAGQGTPGKIELAVDKINTKSGNIYKVEASVSNVKVSTKSNAGKEALAAAGGALLGGLLGGGTWALIGATGGFLVAKNNKENVSIPQGSLVTIDVSQSTQLTR